MTSELRSLASRANGAKSHGPVTPEGKLASSRNSLRHGILSKTIVLEGESSEAFLTLLTSYQEEHQPETPTEEALIENMAIARWRQERIWNMETAGLENTILHPRFPDGDDLPTQAFIAFRTLTDDTRALELLNRYEARCDRQFRTRSRVSAACAPNATPRSPRRNPIPTRPRITNCSGSVSLALSSWPTPGRRPSPHLSRRSWVRLVIPLFLPNHSRPRPPAKAQMIAWKSVKTHLIRRNA